MNMRYELIAFDMDGTLVEEDSCWGVLHRHFGTQEGARRNLRAYERGDHTFAPASRDTTTLILDEAGMPWQVAEAALIGENGEELPRLPGHMAYWFGWYDFRSDHCV